MNEYRPRVSSMNRSFGFIQARLYFLSPSTAVLKRARPRIFERRERLNCRNNGTGKRLAAGVFAAYAPNAGWGISGLFKLYEATTLPRFAYQYNKV